MKASNYSVKYSLHVMSYDEPAVLAAVRLSDLLYDVTIAWRQTYIG